MLVDQGSKLEVAEGLSLLVELLLGLLGRTAGEYAVELVEAVVEVGVSLLDWGKAGCAGTLGRGTEGQIESGKIIMGSVGEV